MANETILVVEDETLVGLELKEDLERLGYSVPEVIESGEEVMQAVARNQPDLVLMDIRLRGSLDGIEAAFQTKAEFDVPIIYLTAYSDADTLRRAALTGPDAFLLKPFDERELAANVQLALSRAKSGEPLRRELRGAISLVEALEEPALIADLDGRIAHANKAAVGFLRVPDSNHLARMELSRVLEPNWNDPVRKLVKVQGHDPEAGGMVASVERLYRSDGREYGTLVVFGNMQRRERLILEASAAEVNSALISLLPGRAAAGPRYCVGGFLDPCLSGSGDFFNVFPAGDGSTAFYALDVMGHGMIASLMAFSLHDLLPVMGMGRDGQALSPAKVVRSLYEHYGRRAEGAMSTTFFTISYGLLDSETGSYRVARAGYTPTLHLEAGGRMQVHYTKGSAVGVMENAEIEEATGRLMPGDRLLFASDGLLFSFGGGLLESSLENLSTFADGLRGSRLEDFVSAFRSHSRETKIEAPKEDDVSLMVIERN